MPGKPGLVVIGAGQAGFQTALSASEAGFAGRIVLIGEEKSLPYQRPPLSKSFLAGAADHAAVWLRPERFFAAHGIELIAGERVTAIDRAARRVRLGSGGALDYDHLVLATGARNRALAVPGTELPGVFGLRTLAEAEALRPALAASRRLVVIGGGFIGLEVAAIAAKAGCDVTVLEAAPRVLGRAVSAMMADAIAAAHRDWGTAILTGAAVTRIRGTTRVAAVETGDGQAIPADLVLVGIGVAPNQELAAEAGLAVDDGIVVGATLLTADPAISAIGDCARFPSPFAGGLVRLESVQNAADQGRAVAARLAGILAPYAAVPWFWSDQGTLKLQIVGLADTRDIAVPRGDPASGAFSVFRFRGERLTAIESLDRVADHMVGRRLLAAGASPTPAQAADPAFDLRSLLPARP